MAAAVRRGRRRALGAAVLAAAVAVLPVAIATASTGTVDGDERAAAAQAVLDRVLGPGGSVVVVADTVQTSTSATSTVRWGSGVVGSVASTSISGRGAGVSRSIVQQDLVGGTTTSTVTPAGALVQQSVSVAVDRAHLGTTRLATIRRLVAAAVGLTPSRGDRLSVVAATFAKAAPPRVPAAPGPLALAAPFVGPLLWTLGGVAALGILTVLVEGRRRSERAAARS
ncbi:flagellar M-ring protein FliF C-terminal domain-containing protein [uncultured Amnibacterium sp.]|uniref:flagellar M-ring protein FliF C-terminal domain-containing protein n=1 Tax=uncultured Amnibacterium sp. TaxID=1631851 RepID=UPI0035CBEBDE